MAEIQEQLDRISSAIYGRDVRSSIHDAIAAINGDVEVCAEGERGREEAESARAKAEAGRASADESRTRAETARASAEEARAKAEEARAQGMKDMEGRISGLMAATGSERVHVCVEGEYSDSADGSPPIPAVGDPKTQVVYLTPVKGGAEHGGYAAWLYVDGTWEALGGGTAEGPLSVAKGGTGGADADKARENLSVYSKAEVDDLVSRATAGAPEGTPVQSGTSFSNEVYATITAIQKGDLCSKVTLKAAGSNEIAAIVPSQGLEQMGAAVGGSVLAAFDEHDLSILSTASISPQRSENIWDGTVTHIEAGSIEERVEIGALGATVHALVSKSVGDDMGLNETSGVKLMVSPYDVHLLPLSRTHSGGGN